MNSRVTVTRSVTTNNTSVIFLNIGYLKSCSGILKILQLILNVAVIGILLIYLNYSIGYDIFPRALFLELIAVAFFICTFCLLVSCIFSMSTGGLISKTLYEFIYHLFGSILLLITSICLYTKNEEYYRYPFYKKYLTAVILAFANAILYFISTLVAFREYRD